MASSAAIIGAGPAGLMAAEALASAGVAVIVYERMPSVGRKFLMAGRGGLNLTHSEPLEAFLGRYGAAEPWLRAALNAFPPAALQVWAEALGQPTFVGSSGRVFPKSFKSSPLLRAWLRRLTEQGVIFRLRHCWTGWDGDALRFETPDGEHRVDTDACVIACGGASWPKLGSDGSWQTPFAEAGVKSTPLAPANGGVLIAWSEKMRAQFAGAPLKRIAIRCGDNTVRGEAVITADGLEGGAIYVLSRAIREAISQYGEAHISLALRPDLTTAQLVAKLDRSRAKQSISNVLRKALALPPVAIALLQEAAIGSGKRLGDMPADRLATLVNALPLRVGGLASITHAISTSGGVSLSELDERNMLRKRPGVFVAGEMLDWEAPTGGYLLQACFATGLAAGRGAADWLGARASAIVADI